MRRALVILVAIVLVVAIWRGIRHSHSNRTGLGGAAVAHSVAPSFSLQDLEGKPLDLASYRGKVVLLNFWATWCTPCRGEIPHFVELQSQYGGRGLQIVGISMDDGPAPVRNFYQEHKMNYPVALGTEKVAEAYGGVLGLPVTFLIDRDGRIAAKFTGAVEITLVQQKVIALIESK